MSDQELLQKLSLDERSLEQIINTYDKFQSKKGIRQEGWKRIESDLLRSLESVRRLKYYMKDMIV